MSDEGDKNKVGNIISGREEFSDLIQCLECTYCESCRIKALVKKIKNNTKEVKYLSVDKILKYKIFRKVKGNTLTTN